MMASASGLPNATRCKTTRVEVIGGWLLALVTAAPLLDGVITRFIDRKTVVTDEWGRALYTSPNTLLGTGTRAVLLGAVCLLSVWLITRAWRSRLLGVSVVPFLAMVIVLSSAMHHDAKSTDLLRMFGQALAVVAAGAMPFCRELLAYVGRYVLVATLSSLTIALLLPDGSWRECRPDKCSIAGKLLSGFFSHENAFTASIVIAAPTLAYLTSIVWRRVGLVAVIVVVAFSGSRSGMTCLIVALAVYALLRLLQHDHDSTGRRSSSGPSAVLGAAFAVAPWAPLACFLASTAVAFVLPADALSERGAIYEVIRAGLEDHPVWGGGRGLLSEAYETGQISFLVEHEHGQAPYVLSTTGVIGWLLMLGVFVHVSLAFSDPSRRELGLLLMAPAALFMTEPTMTLGQAGSVYPMMIAAAMCSAYPLGRYYGGRHNRPRASQWP